MPVRERKLEEERKRNGGEKKGVLCAAEAPLPLLGLVAVAADVPPPRISKECIAAVVLCRRAAVDWNSPLSCCTVSKPLHHRSSLLHHRRSSPWSYPLSPDIKSGHGFVVGDEGYRQDSDIQKVKLSREALTQLSKLVESRVSTGLDTILTLFYSFWNWGCYQVRLNTIYHKSSVCISRGCGWQHLGLFINLGAFYLCGISLVATLAFWVKLRGKELWIGMQWSTIMNVKSNYGIKEIDKEIHAFH
ncbi:hypothetical protein Ahy_A05g022590 isoform E [Arachis hypogaea]|uniref:Uncharacterized protein n=1 Tax=Arachis hypogaea TaxID=3818 RepID=A0A445D119_ARAHY|nr:hypothetical protein Ahy_A05g022590 isoform E [Arachis hypogaea]